MTKTEQVCCIQELTVSEIDQVSGAGTATALTAGGAIAVAAKIGALTYGSGWATVGVGAAFGAAPVAVIGMVLLTGYAGYSLWKLF